MDLEDQQRFQVEAINPFRGTPDLSLRCTRCVRWATHIDHPLTLAELNQRADEHTEACR